MDNEIELCSLEELERNLAVEEREDSEEPAGFVLHSTNGFMAPSANGFMAPSANGFLYP